ncbi:MAG: TerD family protein [Planctomycetota bacterium]|jgi:tellurium resistance protein TerD|nr:TerD family protein [Planctomycetota bacterium]
MAINLQKGQKVELADLSKIVVGLGWDTNQYDGGEDFDLDASAFLLGADGKARSDADFVFYNAPEHPSKSVVSTGDNRTGAGEGDDEQLNVDLTLVPVEVQKIAFTVTIHEAEARKQNFGQVSNSYIRVVNAANDEEIIHYDLGEDFSLETAVVVAELYRHGGKWKFNAIGSGFKGGLAALVKNFGLNA